MLRYVTFSGRMVTGGAVVREDPRNSEPLERGSFKSQGVPATDSILNQVLRTCGDLPFI